MPCTSKVGAHRRVAFGWIGFVAGGLLTATLLGAETPSRTEASSEPAKRTANLYARQDGEGQTYFALSLQAKSLPATGAAARRHVMLVDTSASQVGEHRTQALAVARELLAALPADDEVLVVAVDVQAESMTEAFHAPRGPQAEAALAALDRRVPLGATNLQAGLNAAIEQLGEGEAASIVYIGDGMSTANLIQSAEMQTLLGELRDRQTPVHSYAVGPRTDLQLLGILGQFTGGLVLFDRGETQPGSPAEIGRQLVAGVKAPVYYPETVAVDRNVTLLPDVALPLRTDRETIYLGRGQLDKGLTVDVSTGNGADAITFAVPADAVQRGHSVLVSLYRQAAATDGLTVAFAGESLLNAAQQTLDDRVTQLAAQGELALAGRNWKQAEAIGAAIRQIDPTNVRAKTLAGAAEKVKIRTVAQVEPAEPPAGDDPNSLLPGPGNVPPQPVPPGGGVVDLLEEQEQRQRVIEEQMTLAITRAIEQARRIAPESPATALADLKQARGTVLATTDISPEVREQLARRLTNVIQDVTNLQEVAETRRIAARERLAQLEAQQRLIDQIQRDEERLEQLIDRVRALLEEARHGNDDAYSEARAVAQAAVNLQPGEGTAAAAFFTAEAATQLNRAFRLRALRAERFLETLYQVELSHVPFPDEPPIVYPPPEVWRALTERRRKWASVDLHRNSPAEQRIQQALLDQTEIEFLDTPLKESMDFLSDLHDITIILDEVALTEEGIGTDEPMNHTLSGISLRSALRIMLEPLGLTYIIEDEVMKITTSLAAEEKLSTRVYPVGDLVIPIVTPMAGGLGQGLGGAGGFGGMGGMGGGQFGGGMGMGGMGMGGMGMGGGIYSVPPEVVPDAAERRGLDNAAVGTLKKKR